MGVTPTALPPIQLRNTYPPGQPARSNPPVPLGRTPESAAQIMYPDGVQSTHFQGPLVSGPTPGVAGAAGSALLTLTLQIDYTMGPAFQVPVIFPGGSFLVSISAVTYASGLTATVALGTTKGASDIGSVTLPAKGAVATPAEPSVQLPVWDAVAPLEPFTMWLDVTGVSGTAGGSILVITYMRLAGPWSPPATDYSRL